nr:valine--tRNA ligase, chloroplastic/mitochondrial 2 isoform X1 [Tanacetum cinerariifolium]
LVVERMLAFEGIKRTELGREEFTKRVWEWKEKYGGMITNQIRRLGASCDWTREHFTLDEQLSLLSCFYICNKIIAISTNLEVIS